VSSRDTATSRPPTPAAPQGLARRAIINSGYLRVTTTAYCPRSACVVLRRCFVRPNNRPAHQRTDGRGLSASRSVCGLTLRVAGGHYIGIERRDVLWQFSVASSTPGRDSVNSCVSRRTAVGRIDSQWSAETAAVSIEHRPLRSSLQCFCTRTLNFNYDCHHKRVQKRPLPAPVNLQRTMSLLLSLRRWLISPLFFLETDCKDNWCFTPVTLEKQSSPMFTERVLKKYML